MNPNPFFESNHLHVPFFLSSAVTASSTFASVHRVRLSPENCWTRSILALLVTWVESLRRVNIMCVGFLVWWVVLVLLCVGLLRCWSCCVVNCAPRNFLSCDFHRSLASSTSLPSLITHTRADQCRPTTLCHTSTHPHSISNR